MRSVLAFVLLLPLSACVPQAPDADSPKPASKETPKETPKGTPKKTPETTPKKIPKETSKQMTKETPKLDYEGPKVSAKIQKALVSVGIHVPSGGYDLKLLSTSRKADHIRVEVLLTSPGEGEIVTQAEVDKTTEAKLDGTGPVWIYVRQVQRGAHYLVTPTLALAAVVTR